MKTKDIKPFEVYAKKVSNSYSRAVRVIVLSTEPHWSQQDRYGHRKLEIHQGEPSGRSLGRQVVGILVAAETTWTPGSHKTTWEPKVVRPQDIYATWEDYEAEEKAKEKALRDEEVSFRLREREARAWTRKVEPLAADLRRLLGRSVSIDSSRRTLSLVLTEDEARAYVEVLEVQTP